MSAAFHMLPDSGGRSNKDGAGGDGEKDDEPVSAEAYALGMLMRGIHL
jgi:hypothetical protein